MPVETRAQTRAREQAAKLRETSSRANVLASSAAAQVPASPAAKRAVAAKKASKDAALAAAAAAGGKKGGAKGGKKVATGAKKKEKKSAFDTMVEELGETLPADGGSGAEQQLKEEEKGKSIKSKEEKLISKKEEEEAADAAPAERAEESKATPTAPATVTAPTVTTATTTTTVTTATTATTTQEEDPFQSRPQKADPTVLAPIDTLTDDDESDSDAADQAPSHSHSIPPSGPWVDPYPDLTPSERAETISGYVCYRTDYSHSNEDWEKYKRVVLDKFKRQETRHGKDEAGLEIVWVEDKERFDGDKIDEVRRAFNTWCTERNSHAPNPSTYPFSQGPYQDFTVNMCLAADKQSITSVLLRSYGTSPECPLATILIVDRHYSPSVHATEVSECPENEVGDAPPSSVGGKDPRESDAAVVEKGDKVIWKGYKGFFRSGIDEWMNVESEAQPEKDAPGWWMQYFAKYAEGREGGWELATCGVLEQDD